MSTITIHRSRPIGMTALAGLSLMLFTGCASGGDGADVTALTAPDANVAAACAELTPETMAGADVAFRGTVTAITGDQVMLRVDDEFEGDIEGRVTVPQQPDDVPSEVSIGAFTEGEEYLISATGDVILTCGQSGPATPERAALYEAAF